MAWSLQEELRAKREATERWMRQREADLRRSARELEARGRKVYADAIKTGQQVLARTPAEVRQLGLAAVTGRLPQAAAEAIVRKAAPKVRAAARETVKFAKAVTSDDPKVRAKALKEAGEQLRAGASGAADEVTFGLADRALAAADAVREGGLRDFVDNYRQNMVEKRLEDAYDAEHYGAARNAGRAAGFIGSIALAGAPGAARAILASTPRAGGALRALTARTRYGVDPRGWTEAAAAGGATAGVIDQAVMDAATGNLSSPLDYGRASLAGAGGGIATRYAGPTLGGAAAGAADSVLQDLSRGKTVSVENAMDAAQAGAALGGLAGVAGAHWASELPSHAKGRVGEGMSKVKAVARGDTILARRKQELNPTGYTIADYLSTSRSGRHQVGESKLGPNARLTARQEQARKQFGDDYILDHWDFRDVGRITGAAASPFGARLTDQGREPWWSR